MKSLLPSVGIDFIRVSCQPATIGIILLRASSPYCFEPKMNECTDVSLQIAFSVDLPEGKSWSLLALERSYLIFMKGARCSGHFISCRVRHGPCDKLSQTDYEYQAIGTASPVTSLSCDPAESLLVQGKPLSSSSSVAPG